MSRVTPTAQCWAPTWAIGTNPHTWQVVAQGRSPAAHKAMVHAAKALAATGLDLATSPQLLNEAKAEWQTAMQDEPYVCPIPDEILPSTSL